MIKMQVIGRLGKDCLVNNVNGKNVINFTVAHSEKYKDSQGNLQEKTIWVECAYWTDRTAIAPYLVKGTQVFAEGQPEVRTFTRNDGTSGATLSMRVRDVQLLGNKVEGNAPASGNYNASSVSSTASVPSSSDSGTSGSTAPATNDASSVSSSSIDDLPF